MFPSRPSQETGEFSTGEDIRPAPPFQPPTGYFKPKGVTNSESLRSSRLAEKQLWHISVPASFPIEGLAEISWKDAMGGEPIMEHNEIPYGLLIGDSAPEEEEKLLLMGKDKNLTGTRIEVFFRGC
jgi:hypothetical protein